MIFVVKYLTSKSKTKKLLLLGLEMRKNNKNHNIIETIRKKLALYFKENERPENCFSVKNTPGRSKIKIL